MSTLASTETRFEKIVKETDKAFLMRIDGVDRWIPKSVITGWSTFSGYYPENRTHVWIQNWFVAKQQNTGAMFSDDGKRRYHLWRCWNERKKQALCIGLNPSTANQSANDPTIQRLCRFLNELDFGGFRMVNLFTIISSDPSILTTPDVLTDAVSEQEDLGLIFSNSLICQEVIFCWGAFKQAEERAKKVIEFYGSNAKCFGKTQKGDPWHPLACFYAGLKDADVRLFDFMTHTFVSNKDKRKGGRKRKKNGHGPGEIKWDDHDFAQMELPIS